MKITAKNSARNWVCERHKPLRPRDYVFAKRRFIWKTNENAAKNAVLWFQPAVSPFCPENNWLDDLRVLGNALPVYQVNLLKSTTGKQAGHWN